ncbi:DUF488 domain-containing protein [Pseudoflavitalea rhizosphaerae]|uniref:DUF488 domain-containing protein n=1 Tax=Pseudoflavitalea rhizosphaerae TaxID=1884793 RepID=UPI0019D2E962|nr:DUF488 domain-containing protein [Pseudoflavitalea rhizosphaerae]
MIQIKRAYEKQEQTDGYRILVDRLWPRGLSKATLHADQWLKDVAPSTELRKWFNHDPEKWKEFSRRYKAELKGSDAMKELLALAKAHPVITLVYAAHDEEYNNAIVLQSLISSPAKRI